jgi:class 3 adenylate cyclase
LLNLFYLTLHDIFLKTTTTTRYAAFVPRRVLPHLTGMQRAEPRCGPLEGVVSFLDVAGFTKLTEKLAQQADGAERLAKIINKLMGQLLGTLTTGDVIKFSGDAILVLYEADPHVVSNGEELNRVDSMYVAPSAAEVMKQMNESERSNHVTTAVVGEGKSSSDKYLDEMMSSFKGYENEAGMIDAAYRAVSEGLRALHDDYTVSAEELGDPGGEGIKLALHVAITAGPLEMMHVGGVYGRWEVVMAGKAMQALGPTADNAPTNHLVNKEEGENNMFLKKSSNYYTHVCVVVFMF